MAIYSFAGGYYKTNSIEMSAQEVINFYPQSPQTKVALTQTALVTTPGIDLFKNVSLSGSRGMLLFNDVLYVVNGITLYKIDQTGVVTTIGTLDPGNKVSMDHNGIVIAIVVPDTGKAYFYDGVTLSEIINPCFVGPARSVVYIDGTFVFNNDSDIFVSSTTVVNSGMNFDSLDYGSAEIDPDPIQSMHKVKGQLYAVGRYTIEQFRNIGGEGFPFQRVRGAAIDKGIPGRNAFTRFNNGYSFVGGNRHEDNGVWYIGGNQISKISTPPIDALINKLTDLELKNINLYTYSEDGSFFLVLVLKDTTVVYDLTESGIAQIPIWHERKSTNNTQKWRFVDSIMAYGKTIFADSISGNYGILNNKSYTELGEIPLRTASGSYISGKGLPIFIDALELIGMAGIGDQIDITNPDPKVFLSWSDDGGHTFNIPTGRGMGILNQFNKRTIWRRLGKVDRSRVFRITWQHSKPFTANVLLLTGNTGLL